MKYLCSFILFLGMSLFAQDQINPNIAVMELEGNRLGAEDLEALTNRLRNELFQTKKFKVIERSKMNEILKEQGFQQTGCTNTECAVEIGQLLNVDRIVLGNIDLISGMFSVAIRLVDVKSGEIVVTANEDCQCPLTEVMRATLRNAARKMAGLEADMVAKTGEAPIVKYEGKPKKELNRPVKIIPIWDRLNVTEAEYFDYQEIKMSDKDIEACVKNGVSPEKCKGKPWEKIEVPFEFWVKHHEKSIEEIQIDWEYRNKKTFAIEYPFAITNYSGVNEFVDPVALAVEYWRFRVGFRYMGDVNWQKDDLLTILSSFKVINLGGFSTSGGIGWGFLNIQNIFVASVCLNYEKQISRWFGLSAFGEYEIANGKFIWRFGLAYRIQPFYLK